MLRPGQVLPEEPDATGGAAGPKKGGKRAIAPPVSEVMHHVVDTRTVASIRGGVPSPNSRTKPRSPGKSNAAGKVSNPKTVDDLTGVALTNPARRQFGTAKIESHINPGALTRKDSTFMPPPAPGTLPETAGIKSVHLHKKKLAETTVMAGKTSKAQPVHGNRSTCETLPIHEATKSHGSKDVRDFRASAGDARRMSAFEPHHDLGGADDKPNIGHRSSVNKVIFGREAEDEPPDPRDFGGSAGLSSAQSAIGFLGEPDQAENERIGLEDIPRSMFKPRRKKEVATHGTDIDEVLFDHNLDGDDDGRAMAEMQEYMGAAGMTTKKASERIDKERLSDTKKVQKSGNSQIDELVFMHNMDNSEADDWAEERLYEGAGNRSHTNFKWDDVSTRRTDHLTSDKIYGFNMVQGTDLDGDAEAVDPRDFEGYAGSSTRYLNEREASKTDVSMRARGLGSGVIHPTEVDTVIFGHNWDGSGEEQRDFVGAAGGGPAKKPLKSDIQTVASKRAPPDVSFVATSLHDGAALRADAALAKKGTSKIAAVAEMGEAAGMTRQQAGPASGYMHPRGNNKRIMIKQNAYNLINGGSSDDVRQLTSANDAFDGCAGISGYRLSEQRPVEGVLGKLSNAKRSQPKDMVMDPNIPTGGRVITNPKKSEFGKLYASEAVSVMKMEPPTPAEAAEPDAGDRAGKVSSDLAKMNPRVIYNKSPTGETIFVTPEALLENCAGRRSHADVVDHAKTYARSSAWIEKDHTAFNIIHQDPSVKPEPQGYTHLDRSGISYHDTIGVSSADLKKNLLEFRMHDPESAGKRPNPGMLGDVDEVVFGRDSDGSLTGGHSRHDDQVRRRSSSRNMPLVMHAGADSKALSANSDWETGGARKRKSVSRVANSGVVDEVVFGHDMDLSGPESRETLMQDPVFRGTSGKTSYDFAMEQTLNDPFSRMHMPKECFAKVSSANDCTVDEVVFGHDMDFSGGMDEGVIGRLTEKKKMLYANAAGNKSGIINERNSKPQPKGSSRMYNSQQAVVDDLLYGHDLDAGGVTAEDIKAWQGGFAGRSSVVRNVKDEDDKKKIVPSRPGEMASILNPSHGFEYTKKYAIEMQQNFSDFHQRESAAGVDAEMVTVSANREMMHIDGRGPKSKGGRKQGMSNGAAGVRKGGLPGSPTREGDQDSSTRVVRRTMNQPPAANAMGKPSGMNGRSNNESSLVAAAIGGDAPPPARLRVEAPEPKGFDPADFRGSAYVRALKEGQAMLATPYTAQPHNPRASLDGGGPPTDPGVLGQGRFDVSNAAGRYTKADARVLKEKSVRPETVTRYTPFGLDPSAGSQHRFSTSSSTVGDFSQGTVAKVPIAQRMPQSTASYSQPRSLAIIPAAGVRRR